MKNTKLIIGWLVLVLLFIPGCSASPVPFPYIQLLISGGIFLLLIGKKDWGFFRIIAAGVFIFFLLNWYAFSGL